jgi:hypothetical protein
MRVSEKRRGIRCAKVSLCVPTWNDKVAPVKSVNGTALFAFVLYFHAAFTQRFISRSVLVNRIRRMNLKGRTALGAGKLFSFTHVSSPGSKA